MTKKAIIKRYKKHCGEENNCKNFDDDIAITMAGDTPSFSKPFYKSENEKLLLTEEEISSQDSFKNLSADEKLELISLVYQLSISLYYLYAKDHE